MLDTVFYFLLNMSIASSFVIVALLLIRQIRPLPRQVVYPLWALAFLRLVIPFTLSTKWSLFNFTGGLVKQLITVETVTQGTVLLPEPDAAVSMNFIGAAEQYVPIEYKTESLRQVFSASSVIWALVFAALVLTALILYILTQKELKKAVHVKSNVYHSDMLLSPMLSGLFRPRIILPESLDPDSAEGEMVLAHEAVHRRRLDNLWRLLGILTTCAHWFNPFAWLMLKAFFADMEQSCDEAVIRKYDKAKRHAYAEALLRFAEDKQLLVATAFGRSGVKVRIINVLNYQRMTVIGAVTSALLLLIVTVALMTNPLLRG